MFINIAPKEPLHKMLIKNVFFEIQHFEISERCISKNTFLIKILCKGSLAEILMNMLAKFKKSSLKMWEEIGICRFG